ncbi:MAG TPA: hypothetical protein VF003_15400 [Pseudonocardiaceae bacterium]
MPDTLDLVSYLADAGVRGAAGARVDGPLGEIWAALHRGGARMVPGTHAGIAPFKSPDVLPYGSSR